MRRHSKCRSQKNPLKDIKHAVHTLALMILSVVVLRASNSPREGGQMCRMETA